MDRENAWIAMPLRAAIPTACLYVVAVGGYVKGTWPLSALPVDLTLVAGAGVLVGVVLCLTTPERRFPNPALTLSVLLTTALAIGLLRQPLNDYAVAKRLDVLIVLPICLFAGMLLLDSRTSRRLWLALTLVYGPVVIVLALINPSPLADGRLWPDGGSTIGVGRTCGAALVLAWCLILARRRRRLAVALFPVLFLGLVLSESRGPIAAALAAMAVMTLCSAKHARRTALLAASGLAATLLVALALKPERLTSLSDASASIRFKLWEQTFSLSVVHPLNGIGWGNLYRYQEPDERLITGVVQYPHNVVLEVASEAGLLALAALILFVVLAFRALWVAARHDVVELGMLGLLVFFLMNALASGDIGSNRELWVALGSAWGGLFAQQRSARSPMRASQVSEPLPTSAR